MKKKIIAWIKKSSFSDSYLAKLLGVSPGRVEGIRDGDFDNVEQSLVWAMTNEGVPVDDLILKLDKILSFNQSKMSLALGFPSPQPYLSYRKGADAPIYLRRHLEMMVRSSEYREEFLNRTV